MSDKLYKLTERAGKASFTSTPKNIHVPPELGAAKDLY